MMRGKADKHLPPSASDHLPHCSIASPKSSSVGLHSLFLSGFRRRCHEATGLTMTSSQTSTQALYS
jgi:hypothetical protein